MSPDDPAALPADAILAVDPVVLAGALHDIPDRENGLLRLADGRRTAEEVVAGSGLDAATAAASLARLLDAGVLRVVPPGATPVEPAPPVAAAHPGPEAADWFAHPAPDVEPGPLPDPPAASLPVVSPAVTLPPPARDRDARRPGRGRLAVAAVALGAVVVAGAISVQRQRGEARPVRAPPEPSTAARPPPALAVTEPAAAAAYRDAVLEVGARQGAGDLAGAAEACRRAIAIDPAAGAAWLALGEVSLAAGDRDRARSAFERYLAVEPGGEHAARVRALLERLRP